MGRMGCCNRRLVEIEGERYNQTLLRTSFCRSPPQNKGNQKGDGQGRGERGREGVLQPHLNFIEKMIRVDEYPLLASPKRVNQRAPRPKIEMKTKGRSISYFIHRLPGKTGDAKWSVKV